MTLPIRLIRKMILVAMVLIVFSNVAQWVGDSMHKIVATLWGIAAAGLAYFCRTKAMKSHTAVLDKRYYLWLMVPVVLTLIPLFLRIDRLSCKSATTFRNPSQRFSLLFEMRSGAAWLTVWLPSWSGPTQSWTRRTHGESSPQRSGWPRGCP